jgi:hypothetical protein
MTNMRQTMSLNGCAEYSPGPVRSVGGLRGVVPPGQHCEVVGAPSDAS